MLLQVHSLIVLERLMFPQEVSAGRHLPRVDPVSSLLPVPLHFFAGKV